jgi:hypothetical protein
MEKAGTFVVFHEYEDRNGDEQTMPVSDAERTPRGFGLGQNSR